MKEFEQLEGHAADYAADLEAVSDRDGIDWVIAIKTAIQTDLARIKVLIADENAIKAAAAANPNQSNPAWGARRRLHRYKKMRAHMIELLNVAEQKIAAHKEAAGTTRGSQLADAMAPVMDDVQAHLEAIRQSDPNLEALLSESYIKAVRAAAHIHVLIERLAKEVRP